MIFVGRYNRAGWAKDAEAYVPSAIDYYITPEIREEAMKLLHNRRDMRDVYHANEPWVAPPNDDDFYVTPEAREEAMKLLEKDDRYQQAHDPVVVVEEATVSYVSPKAKEKAVELYAKTEQDEFNKKPKLANGANPQFLVVRYGWYAFAFLLEEGDVRGPALNAKAIQICEAMLTLESGDEQKYMSGLAEAKAFAKRDRQKRKAGRTTR